MSLLLLFRRWLDPGPAPDGTVYRLRGTLARAGGPSGIARAASQVTATAAAAAIVTGGVAHV